MSSEKTSPENLVSMLRELTFDDTLREVKAVMRFDIKIQENAVVTQLLVDLRHKENPRLSKPRFYGTMSSMDQHINLLTAATVMTVLNHHRDNLNMKPDDIRRSIRSLHELVVSDSVFLAEQLMVAVQKRKSDLAYKQETL